MALILPLTGTAAAFSSPNVNNDRVVTILAVHQESPHHGRCVTRSSFINSSCIVASFPAIANAANLPPSNGADLSRTGSLDTLVPIVKMRRSISNAKSVLSDGNESTLVSSEKCTVILKGLLATVPREEKQFKRIFDSYSTPVSYKQKFLDQNAFLVYYSKGFDGPGRPSIENTGSDVENSIQTMQYGFRNEAWTAVDDVFTELEFGAKGSADSVDAKDLHDLIGRALMAFDSYLSLAPEADVREAEGVNN